MQNNKKKLKFDIVILDTTGFSEELKQSCINQTKTIVEDDGVILTTDGIIKNDKTSGDED